MQGKGLVMALVCVTGGSLNLIRYDATVDKFTVIEELGKYR